MDNAQKAIMIGVGLFIAIIIISAVLLITNMGSGLIKNATGKLETIGLDLQNQIVKDFDGQIKSGSEVLSVMNMYYMSTSVALHLQHNAEPLLSDPLSVAGAQNVSAITGTIGTLLVKSDTVAPFTSTSPRTAQNLFTNISSVNYIDPTVQYSSSVIRNANGVVIGIAFKRI